MSFVVVTKGPVAIAGSIPNFFNISGMKAPTMVETIIIDKSETEITSVNLIDSI